MACRNDDASANLEQIRTDLDCRAARSRFDDGAWSSARISDATDDDLCLFVTPDESRPGSAAIKRPGCPTSDIARIEIPAERRDLSTITHLFAPYCLRDA